MNRELTQKLHKDYMKASKLTSYISHGIFLLLIIASLIYYYKRLDLYSYLYSGSGLDTLVRYLYLYRSSL